VSPLQLAIDSVERAIASFRPRSLPPLLRANYARELAAWCFLPLMLGAVEGGVTGVLAKTFFAGAIEPHRLNLGVAVLAGAPAFANIVSFLWAALSLGRNKIRMLAVLQAAAAICVLLVAAIPRSELGLWLLMIGAVGTRMCWSGVVTLRSTVWRANYPRYARARLAGKLAAVQALIMTLAGLSIGAAFRANEDAFRLLYPIAAVGGLIGAWIYSGLRMRGHRALLRAESNDQHQQGSRVNPLQLRRVLLADARFRRYMTCMFVFGTGNLMVTAPLVIMLKDRFELDPLQSVLIAASVPTLLMPVSIPLWSRLLDRVHVIRFRAVHSWAFVASTAMLLAGAVTRQVELLWLGAVLKGVAFGGGVLGWNLGHHDFAPVERASQYMGVHVTLTGIRGLLAPMIAVGLYEILEWQRPGAGAWTLALCLGLNIIGALWFMAMRRTLTGQGCEAGFEDGPPIQPPAAL
jgi:MFS family permease